MIQQLHSAKSMLRLLKYLAGVLLLIGGNVFSQGAPGQSGGLSVLSGKEAPFSTMYGAFERMYFAEGAATDTTRGEFYFLGEDQIYVRIHYPLNQILAIDGNETTVYYPDARRAFRLISENPAAMPIIPGLISAIRYENGMSDIGFELTNQAVNGDTIVTTWHHPEAREVGSYELGEVEDRLAYSLFENAESSIFTRTDFKDYTDIQHISFPTIIRSLLQTSQGLSREHIKLDKLDINLSVPQEIVGFEVPSSIRVERRRW